MGADYECGSECDKLDVSTIKIDELIGHINNLVKNVELVITREAPSQVQTVIHRTEGMGPWGAAAVTACMFTFLGLILFALWAVPEIHDLKAWVSVHTTKINSLESRSK